MRAGRPTRRRGGAFSFCTRVSHSLSWPSARAGCSPRAAPARARAAARGACRPAPRSRSTAGGRASGSGRRPGSRARPSGRLVGDDVPLVVGDRDRLVGVLRDRDHAHVLAVEARFGFGHDHDDVRALDRADRAQRGVELGVLGELRLVAQARGVDQREAAGRCLIFRIHGIHGRAGLGVDDHALLVQQRVDERALADVGPSDDRDADRAVVRLLGLGRRQERDHAVEQIADADPLLARDGPGIPDPQAIELVLDRHARVVRLVDDQKRRALALEQRARVAPSRSVTPVLASVKDRDGRASSAIWPGGGRRPRCRPRCPAGTRRCRPGRTGVRSTR